MALDSYSFCPCGNGKKIKFCKCADSLHEMDTVMQMIDGEQSVAALDRINSLIEKLPSDAWLLAVKSELLLKLNELDSLEETSAKFIRLRPDNPLASMFRSIVAITRGSIEESANLLLTSLANSGENVHPMFINCVFNLVQAMTQRSMTLPALMYTELLTEIASDAAEIGERLISQLLGNAADSVLVRDSAPSPSDYEDKEWFERFQEAHVLLQRYQVSQARTKLESLQREFGDQYAILVGLIHCRLLQADQKGAASLCQKIPQIDDVAIEQKAYWQAIAWEFDETDQSIRSTDAVVSYEIEDPQAFEEKLQSMDILHDVKDERMTQFIMSLASEEVAPKAIYTIVLPWNYKNAADYGAGASTGWIAFFGKQTDKPARVVVTESYNDLRSEFTEQFLSACSLDSSKGEKINEFPARLALQVTLTIVTNNELTETQASELRELSTSHTKERIRDLKFEFLDNKTVGEAAKDKSLQAIALAILLNLEASGNTNLNRTDFAELTKEIGLPSPALSSEHDVFDMIGGASYFWTDLETVDQRSLIQLCHSAIARNIDSVYERYLAKATSVDWQEDLKLSADYTIQTMGLKIAKSPEEASQLMLDLYNTGSKLGVTIGGIVLERVELLNSMGKREESQKFLEMAFTEHPKDPALMQFMQMAMMQMQQQMHPGGESMGGGGVGDSLMRHATTAPRPASKMFDAEPSPSDSAAESNDSGSGLWIPGQ